MLKPYIEYTDGKKTYSEDAENITEALNKANNIACAGFRVIVYQCDEMTGDYDILYEI